MGVLRFQLTRIAESKDWESYRELVDEFMIHCGIACKYQDQRYLDWYLYKINLCTSKDQLISEFLEFSGVLLVPDSR